MKNILYDFKSLFRPLYEHEEHCFLQILFRFPYHCQIHTSGWFR